MGAKRDNQPPSLLTMATATIQGRTVMADTDKRDDTAKDKTHPVKPVTQPAGPRDEAKPGTPGTGETIDPKTGERYTEGIGGA